MFLHQKTFMLEPTIGNHDQNFLDNWYSKLKPFSLSLMKDVVQFCGKTIDANTIERNTTESSLKSNVADAKKYCNNKNSKSLILWNINWNLPVSLRLIKKKAHKANQGIFSTLTFYKVRKGTLTNLKRKKATTLEQLQASSINNKGISASRSTLSANQNQEVSLKQQIKHFQQEVEYLKWISNINETNSNPSAKEPKQQEPTTYSKNAEMYKRSWTTTKQHGQLQRTSRRRNTSKQWN